LVFVGGKKARGRRQMAKGKRQKAEYDSKQIKKMFFYFIFFEVKK